MEILNTTPDREITVQRILNFPIELVYKAFEEPNHLKNWWGPEGFTNTIHEFDLRVGGNWILTMHGPEKGNYENSSVFKTVLPNKLISWERKSQPLFDMEIAFEKLEENKTQISFKMIFATTE
ncbi:MAG: SRPBCC domain-containing protein, partial [Ignavibacteriae bacterium]|nr:SRPBCC domain-containing protein [Ignavibacteriota bacterium]